MCAWIKCACLYFHSVVGCHRPPVPTHGSTEGLFHHSGARITFRCDPGFELRGVRSAICLRDGTWSASAPKCGRIMMWTEKKSFACLHIPNKLLQRWCRLWTKAEGQLLKSLFFFFLSVSSASGKSVQSATQANTWGPLLGLWTQWCPHRFAVYVQPALWTQWELPENLPPKQHLEWDSSCLHPRSDTVS